MRLVLLESPYAGNKGDNVYYAHRCMRHSMQLGEATMVSHLLYTQVLDDDNTEQREAGIAFGDAWLRVIDALVVYTDRGITPGMQHRIDLALEAGVPVEYRKLQET